MVQIPTGDFAKNAEVGELFLWHFFELFANLSAFLPGFWLFL